MHKITSAEQMLRWSWNQLRKMLEQQLQTTDTIGSNLPCMDEGNNSSRHKRRLKEQGKPKRGNVTRPFEEVGLKPMRILTKLHWCSSSNWLFNKQGEMLLQIKPDAPTQHAEFVLVSDYRLSAHIGKSDRQQRMLRHRGIAMWISQQKIGWQRRAPPN